MIALAEELAQNESAQNLAFIEKAFKIYDEERPHTLVHGDCNAGNTWKPIAGDAHAHARTAPRRCHRRHALACGRRAQRSLARQAWGSKASSSPTGSCA